MVDIHKGIERLKAAGVDEKAAEIIINLVNKRDEQLATKADIDKLQFEIENIGIKLESKIDVVESRKIDELESNLCSKIDSIESRLDSLDINKLVSISKKSFILLLIVVITMLFK